MGYSGAKRPFSSLKYDGGQESNHVNADEIVANKIQSDEIQSNKIQCGTYSADGSKTTILPNIGKSSQFVLTESDQTINGKKTFSETVHNNTQSGHHILTDSINQIRFRPRGIGDLERVNINTPQSTTYENQQRTLNIPEDAQDGSSFITDLGDQKITGALTVDGQKIESTGYIKSTKSAKGLKLSSITAGDICLSTGISTATDREFFFPDVDEAVNVFVSEKGAQDINGVKTFKNGLKSNNFNSDGDTDINFEATGTGRLKFNSITNNGTIFYGKSEGTDYWSIKTTKDSATNDTPCTVMGNHPVGTYQSSCIGSNNNAATAWTPFYIQPVDVANAWTAFGGADKTEVDNSGSKVYVKGKIHSTDTQTIESDSNQLVFQGPTYKTTLNLDIPTTKTLTLNIPRGSYESGGEYNLLTDSDGAVIRAPYIFKEEVKILGSHFKLKNSTTSAAHIFESQENAGGPFEHTLPDKTGTIAQLSDIQNPSVHLRNKHEDFLPCFQLTTTPYNGLKFYESNTEDIDITVTVFGTLDGNVNDTIDMSVQLVEYVGNTEVTVFTGASIPTQTVLNDPIGNAENRKLSATWTFSALSDRIYGIRLKRTDGTAGFLMASANLSYK